MISNPILKLPKYQIKKLQIQTKNLKFIFQIQKKNLREVKNLKKNKRIKIVKNQKYYKKIVVI